ncbi:MAG: chromate efflux transporter [Acidobacteriia bacterium]|nr:chromate efflux transporter [Terriglobia bacterium]
MSHSNATSEQGSSGRQSHGLGEILRVFFRLGFIAFGGPPAHFALMEEEFVRRRAWLSRERFVDLVGAVSLLPGPSSTELAIYLGQIRGGALGLLLAGMGFILPSALLVTALAWVYQQYGTIPQVAGLLSGVKPVVVVIVAQAIWSLGRTALKSLSLGLLAGAAVLLAAWGAPPVALLLGGGVLAILAAGEHRLSEKLLRRSLWWPLGGAVPAAVGASLSAVFLYFLKIGAVVFGSGFVLLAFLRADLVAHLHWLTDAQLLDAIAVSQATPGPFFTVATFIGYLLGGWRGAALATLGMFLPAFLYVAATARFLVRLRQSPLAGAFLDGVNAAAIALMGVVGWQFARATLLSPLALILVAVSGILLFRYRLNSAWLILGGAVAGFALSLFAGK